MEVYGEISGIQYKPLFGSKLKTFSARELTEAMHSKTRFLLEMNDQTTFAISRWVSPKRSRSYPHARVYDTLQFAGKRVTIIPIVKDEGIGGDRDFLQWNTLSLMSLLGVYVIIGYYIDALRVPGNPHKVTKQQFDIAYLAAQLQQLLYYHSDPLHWNFKQVEEIDEVAYRAQRAYAELSKKLKIAFHTSSTEAWEKFLQGKETFLRSSRDRARIAQQREIQTVQPKEMLSGKRKAALTITNYLGGTYHFTCDELIVDDDTLVLVEAKHSRSSILPARDDIKDGLIKMMLYTNLRNLRIGDLYFQHSQAILKLTSSHPFTPAKLSRSQRQLLKQLSEEAQQNNFKVQINDQFLDRLYGAF